MQSKKVRVYNVIILDESGSMSSVLAPTIRGFNEVVQTINEVKEQFPDQEHFASLVTFSGRNIKTVFWNENTSRLRPLTESDYQPAGGTPLFDAIGLTCKRLEEEIGSGNRTSSRFNFRDIFKKQEDPKEEIESSVFVTIITDGEENSSLKFSGIQIKNMIESFKERNWIFAYIGTDHNVEAVAQRMSINNVMRFEKNERDMEMMIKKDKAVRYFHADALEDGDLEEFKTNNIFNKPEDTKK
jgi:hypothetical protein